MHTMTLKMPIPRLVHIIIFFLFTGSTVLTATPIPNDFEDLFNERVKSVVIVKLFIKLEIDRTPVLRQGVVIDNEGRIILVGLPATATKQLKDFKVFIPGEGGNGYSAKYLGMDELNDTHFIQVEESVRDRLTPVTQYPHRPLKTGEFLWGIAIMQEENNFKPYFLNARLSIIQSIPLDYGFTLPGLASPGALVFTADGSLAGWAQRDLIQELFIYMQGSWIPAAIQRKDESGSFLTAEPFLEQIKLAPESPSDTKRPWAGIAGLQSIDQEVADMLGLKNQGAVVISDIVQGGPADMAGLQSKDIVIAIDKEDLHPYKPDSVVIEYLKRAIKSSHIGDIRVFTIIRNDEKKDVKIIIGDNPTPYSEADWKYFPRLGFSIREFLIVDGIRLRTLKLRSPGVIARFTKPNSPISAAGLRRGDWIKEIDGKEIAKYSEAIDILQVIDEDESRNDFVLLVSRDNETKVLRIKLN